MTMGEMLDYVTRYNGMKFENQPKLNSEHNTVYNKIYRLLEKFGFAIVRLKGEVVTFRKEELHGHTDVTLSYKKIPGYVKGTETIIGSLVVKNSKPIINPHTNEPWKIGDIDYSSPLQPRLTEYGWWSGE